MKTIMKKKTMRNVKVYRQSLGRRITAAFMAIFMLMQICLPAVAAALTISDEKLSKLLAADLLFELSTSPEFQYQKAKYLGVETTQQISTLESFHQRLKSANVALPEPIKTQPIGKLVGDVYVQTRLIRAQVNEMLGRHLIDPALFATELQQSNGLYDAAFTFAQNTPTAIFGQEPPEGTNLDMIWPEYRTINNERVLVPVVYLKVETIQARAVKGITNDFDGDAVFLDVVVAKDALLEQRSGFLAAMRNITNNGGTIHSSESLNLFARGTLSNISGKITAAENLEIIAGQIINKTVVVPYTFKNGSATRLGEIAEMNATNGSISLKSYSDIIFEGGIATANGSITFDAARDIILRSTLTTSNSTGRERDWEVTSSSLDVAQQSKLTANETIKLIAGGTIQISGAELVSTRGGIELLASQGIYVLDELSQEQITKIDRKGKTTGQSSEFRTEAVRAVLKAGKGVLLDTEFGDVTLKAANIETVDGTQVTARNGKVNMLMTQELEEFHLNTVRKGTWTIKTKSVDIVHENNISNTIIGGFDVDAANGVNVEFTGEAPEPNPDEKKFKAIKALVGGKLANALYSIDVEYKGVQETEEDTLKRQIDEYRNMPGMEWMATIYDQEWVDKNADPDAPSAPNTVNWTAVEEVHKEIRKSNTSLSPAAMAIIAIAVCVAMGPAGAGMIGPGGSISAAVGGGTFGAAVSAGALTMATQATQSLAAGNNLRETLNAMDSDESLKSLAISMATAGALEAAQLDMFKVPEGSPVDMQNLAKQAGQAVVNSAVTAGISVTINGGNSDDYFNSFKTSLASAAVSKIGEVMANKIGDLSKTGQITDAVKYIAHAGAGCVIGVAKAEVSNTSNSDGCSFGAGGAVVGEIVADVRKSQTEVGQDAQKLEEFLIRHGLTDQSNLTPKQRLELLNLNINATAAELTQFKDSTIDLAKLSAGLSAFVAGGDATSIDVAAYTAENAATNNALFLIPVAIFLIKAIDIALTVNEFYEIYQEYQKDIAEGTTNARDKLVAKFGEALAEKIITNALPGGTTFKVFMDKLGEQNIVSPQVIAKAQNIIDDVPLINKMKGKEPAVPAQYGNVSCSKVDKSCTVIPLNGGHEQLMASEINKTKKEIEDLKNTPGYDPKELNALQQKLGSQSEQLTELVMKSGGYKTLDGGKLPSNQGVDHTVLMTDADGNMHVVVIDTKQIDGNFKLGTTNEGQQLSDSWINAKLNQMDPNSDAYIAIDKAQREGTLTTAVAGIDNKTGEFKIIPVNAISSGE